MPVAYPIRGAAVAEPPLAACCLEDAAQAVIAATARLETSRATGSAFHIGNGTFVTAAHLVDRDLDAITLRNERIEATASVIGRVPRDEGDLAIVEAEVPAELASLGWGGEVSEGMSVAVAGARSAVSA